MTPASSGKTLELISFKLCPFVQRSVITLLEKDIDFELTHIDLDHPPEWFLKISPLARVPVLRVDDVVLFESAVINEYLDEVTYPPLHPQDALTRARHRAWVAFGSDMIMNHYAMLSANDETSFHECLDCLKRQFLQLEEVISDGPYFDGKRLSLVDTAFAPLLMRIELMNDAESLGLYEQDSRIAGWAQAILKCESVRASVSSDFEDAYSQFVSALGGFYEATNAAGKHFFHVANHVNKGV